MARLKHEVIVANEQLDRESVRGYQADEPVFYARTGIAVSKANMNGQTLHYVTAHVPKFGAVVSKINLDTLEVVFDELPKIAKCFEHMDP
ncbi:hypothetical protein TSMEX_007864 [Taenia solium]|eukprot:TsM_000868200 transcript=TsM_000868200 gene=TsM_000868200